MASSKLAPVLQFPRRNPNQYPAESCQPEAPARATRRRPYLLGIVVPPGLEDLEPSHLAAAGELVNRIEKYRCIHPKGPHSKVWEDNPKKPEVDFRDVELPPGAGLRTVDKDANVQAEGRVAVYHVNYVNDSLVEKLKQAIDYIGNRPAGPHE